MNPSDEEFLKENERFRKAVRLEEPDRVPITFSFHFFLAKYAGMTYYEYMYDPEKAHKATAKVTEDFNLNIPLSIPGLEAFF